MSLIVGECPPFPTMSPPHSCIPFAYSKRHGRLATCQAVPHAADGRRAQTACRRYAMAHQTVPPTPPDPTTPALLPSRNQHPRRLCPLCWQDAACMERLCRLSAAQADVSRRSVTCIRGTGASAIVPQVYPPPASSATAFNVLPPWPMCCLGAEAHPPPSAIVSSSPSARSGIRRDCAAGTHPSRPERARADAYTLTAFDRRCQLIVKLTEPKLFMSPT